MITRIIPDMTFVQSKATHLRERWRHSLEVRFSSPAMSDRIITLTNKCVEGGILLFSRDPTGRATLLLNTLKCKTFALLGPVCHRDPPGIHDFHLGSIRDIVVLGTNGLDPPFSPHKLSELQHSPRWPWFINYYGFTTTKIVIEDLCQTEEATPVVCIKLEVS